MLNPEHIVFVGGSAVEPSIEYNRRLGFRGKVNVINPTRDTLGDIPCHRNVADIDGNIDLAFVAVPVSAAVDAVRELATNGVGAAIVNTAGFSERSCDGARLEEQLLEAAGDMPFMGPNCPGMANFVDGSSAMIDNLGVMHCERGVAVISNGGAFLADISCSDRSLPLSYLVGPGNQANLSIPELVTVVLEDDRVSAVLLYLESFPDCAHLASAAITALERKIPVVALKCGKSRSGSRAAQSHTASMTGDRVVASALFRKLGIVEVETASEAMETLKVFTYARPVEGSKIAFTTSSGTYAVTGADALEQQGFELPPLSEEAKARVQPHIASFLNADNPLDIATGQFIPDEDQARIFDALLEDHYDLAVQCMSFPAENTWEDESWYRSATVFARSARARNIQPVFLSPTHEGLPLAARQMLIEQGSVPLQGYHEGCLALAKARDWWSNQHELDPKLIGVPAALQEPGGGVVSVPEYEAKARIETAGVAIPVACRWGLQEPVPLDLKYPVVLKVLEPALLHKTESGGVHIGIVNAEQLLEARAMMLESLARSGLEAKVFLIEEQIADITAELMLGIRRVPEVGLTLTLAMGGTMVELISDSATLILPVDEDEVSGALSRLRLYPLLIGWRGAPISDIDQLVTAVMSICRFAWENRDTLVELEINPLALRGNQAPVALDAVLTLEAE